MWSLLAAAALVASPNFEIRTADGQTASGALVEFSKGGIVLANDDGPSKFAASQVIGLAPVAAPAPPSDKPTVWVELADGTSLRALSFAVKQDLATISLAGGGAAQLSTRALASVRFKSQSADQQAQWQEILAHDRNGDLLVIRKKGTLDYLTGAVGDTTEDSFRFTLDGDTLNVKLSKLEGVIYHHPAALDLPAAFCKIVDASGSGLQVMSTSVVGEKLRVQTPAGLELDLNQDQIAAIEFKTRYLSDLAPESATWTPFIGQTPALTSLQTFYRPRLNLAFDGGPLRLAGKTYAKGIALHSRSEVVFRLPSGKFTALQAVAGIDDRVRPEGNARLQVFGDDKLLWDGAVTGADDPQVIDVKLQGVRRLRILVDFGDDLDVADYVDFCEPRILE